MYVIFPLDELLDLNSARENKRGRAALEKQSHTRHAAEVIPLSQPNQQLPNQLKPPLSKQPQTHQQSALTQQQQKQPSPSQRSSLTKTPSKTSIIVSPSTVIPPQSPASVLSSSNSSLQVGNVKKTPTVKQTVQQQQQHHHLQQQSSPLPPLDPVHKRQRSSHSTSTETSSNSSTGAKGKALLSPQAPGGAATNRSSWSGSPPGPLQESCPARTGSFRAFKDLTVSGDGNSLKLVELSRAESSQDIHGSLLSVKTPVTKSNSFRSHLSDSCAQLPRRKGVEAIKKPQVSPASLTPEPPISSEGARKLQETPEQPEPKASEAVAHKEGTPSNTTKEKRTSSDEGIKIKQEVPLLSSPPSQQLTTAESLRIQQECLAPASPDSKAFLSNQRHPSGRSKHSSGSQKLSEIPPSGIGGGARGAVGSVTAGSTNLKNPGSSGSLRGLHQRNTVMASNEASFRDLTNPTVNESLKSHNAFTFKLVKTGPSSGQLEESQTPDERTDH